jgi:hypothetical protein
MRQAATRHLMDYWEGLREGRSSPAGGMADDPAETSSQFATMRAALSDTFLLDVDPERMFPLCAVGGRLEQLLLSPLFGAPFVECWRPEQRDELADLLTMVCRDFTPLVASVWAAPEGAEPLAFEMLLLPLRRSAGHATLLGGLSPSAVPDWYGQKPVEPLRLVAWRRLARAADAPAPRIVRERLVLIQGGRMDVETPR